MYFFFFNYIFYNNGLTPIELSIDISTIYCNSDTTVVRAIKSGNIISFSGRITMAKQTSSGNVVRIAVIRDTTSFSSTTVVANGSANITPIMSVKENGEIYL